MTPGISANSYGGGGDSPGVCNRFGCYSCVCRISLLFVVLLVFKLLCTFPLVIASLGIPNR